MTSIESILRTHGLEELIPMFESQGIDDSVLAGLTDSDLALIGVSKLGDRKKLLNAFSAKTTERDSRNLAAPAPLIPIPIPWYRRTSGQIWLFIFAPYVQMPIMWIHKLYSQSTRIILTVAGSIWLIFLFTQKTPETKPPHSTQELKSQTATNGQKGNRVALDNFEQDLAAINVFALKASGNAGNNAENRSELFSELFRKIDVVNVQQIPAELRDAWNEYRISIRKFLDYLQSVKLKGQSALRPATGTKEWAAMVDETRATVGKLRQKGGDDDSAY